MTAGRPTVYTIAPGRPFADTLAAGVLAKAVDEPLSIARFTILLPTRRACRTMQDAFLRQSGGTALLLPRLQPIGDIDVDELLIAGEEPLFAGSTDLPPAISELKRRLLLAQLILKGPEAEDMSADQATWLAAELARLIDQVQTERLSFDDLEGLVPADHAEHWGRTLDFLRIVTTHWPDILAERGASDPAARRNLLLEAQAAAWRDNPPSHPIIAAGSTGSIPATADLLKTVATLPHGCVVLPGLDRHLDDEAWECLIRPEGGDQSHPQHGLARLLAHLGVGRDDVGDWEAPSLRAEADPSVDRTPLLSEALRPAQSTDHWRSPQVTAEQAASTMADVDYVECPGPREEAGVIALTLRRALERPGETACLVTPDRDLARRVAVELGRWNIAIDDSAGVPLAATPVGAFLRLTAQMVVTDFAPIPLLAALKHPLASGGETPGVFRARIRQLERAVLRGPRPAPSLDGLHAALDAETRDGRQSPETAALRRWIDRLGDTLDAFADMMNRRSAPVDGLMSTHVRAAEALAASEEAEGTARLWAGDAGEAAALFVDEALQATRDFPAIEPHAYAEMLDALMAGRVVRPRYGRHPRLQILGLLEARLQHADTIVLGGLNEGCWPPEPTPDPWMSRPMRSRFGLPLPERRIGLTAHDFCQALGAPRVVMTRAQRQEGAPTVPSRWLLRLETLMSGLTSANPAAAAAIRWRDHDLLDLYRALGTVETVVPTTRPAPRPPVSARPRRLSVTTVETWMRDPYALYARAILKLKPLDPIDADPGAADRGLFIHRALDAFIKQFPRGPLPDDALDQLLACGRTALGGAVGRPGVWAFWWPRFEAIAGWFVAEERERRSGLRESFAEVKGELQLSGPAGAFTLTAKADRLDRMADDALSIIDYKTGAVPSQREIEAGFSPQLPLEAAIALGAGFPSVGPVVQVADLSFWRLTGGRRAGEIRFAATDPNQSAAEARVGLERMIRRFDDPETTYPAQPRSTAALRFNDYAHLARIKEWSVVDGEAEA